MLLLVIDADLDETAHFIFGFDAAREEVDEGAIDMVAVGEHFGMGRARQQAAVRARMARAEGFVIGIEAKGETLVEAAIGRQMTGEHEGLEEPGHMREMPFGRAGVGHRLDGLILDRERGGEFERSGSRRDEALAQIGAGFALLARSLNGRMRYP